MDCTQCGASNTVNARFCRKCGLPMDSAERRLVAQEMGYLSGLPANAVAYGGFWRRVVAALIDSFVLVVPLMALAAVLGAVSAPNDAVSPGWGLLDALSLVIGWLYWAGFHSSRYQATPGKLVLGLQVTDLAGARISFARATGRYFAEFLSALLFLIGYLMVAFTRRKQGLHDIIAGTLVIRPTK